MSAALFTTSLLMGLTGSLHCAGMCGPIVMMMPFRQMNGRRKWTAIILYHMGRILVYTIMGMLIYSLKAVINPAWQQHFSVFAGAVLLLFGLLSFTGTLNAKLPWTGFVQKHWSRLFAHPGMPTFFSAGMLNGLLPCGLVYMALSVCVSVSSWADAALQMSVFGLGTAPMLVAVTLLGQRVTLFRRPAIQRMIPVTLIVLSGLLMLRGMNLGVPYLSPKMTVEKEVVKSSCCTKPADK